MSGASDIYRNRAGLGLPPKLNRRLWIETVAPYADTYMYFDAKTTNYGTSHDISITPYTYTIRRGLLAFNLLSLLPTPFTVLSATLRMYATATQELNRTIAACRLLRTDWVETEATWDIYKTGSNWATGGCLDATTDYTEVDKAISYSLAAANWVEWYVTKQVQTAFDSVSGVAHFLLYDVGATSPIDNSFASRQEEGANGPQLVVCGYQ